MEINYILNLYKDFGQIIVYSEKILGNAIGNVVEKICLVCA